MPRLAFVHKRGAKRCSFSLPWPSSLNYLLEDSVECPILDHLNGGAQPRNGAAGLNIFKCMLLSFPLVQGGGRDSVDSVGP